MPVEGLPDPAKHRVCMRCTKWFEPDEGYAARRERFGITGAIADGIRNSAGDVDLRFICIRCESIKRNRQRVIYGLLVLAFVWAAIKDLGWL